MLTAALLLLHFQAGSVDIPAADPHIRYVGRWDFRDKGGPRAQWSGSSVAIKFSGRSLSVTFAGSPDYWVEEVDGKPVAKLQFADGQTQNLMVTDRPEKHLVRLIKATEAFVGTGQFIKFSVWPGTKLLDIPTSAHRIEVIGDSISCGYGNEGASEKEHFKPSTENAYLSYGAIASRALHADFTDIAWSGRKMWPDNTVPEIYDYALPTDKTSLWGFGMPGPDVIVINLATNDFGGGLPNEKGWTTAYSEFVERLRTHSPRARIYFAIGTMMNDGWPPNSKSLTVLHKYLQEVVEMRLAAGDRNVAVVDFGVQDGAVDGLGSDWHPSIKTHQKMAQKLVDTIKKDLKW